MTEISYTYEIVHVGADSMEIEYTNPTYGTMRVGTRLPFEDENVEDVVKTASPAIFWDQQDRPKASVEVGTQGSGSTRTRPTPLSELTPEERLQKEREGMVVSRLQGRLTLGEDTCDELDAIAADPDTVWPMKQAILHAVEWQRLSETMDELAYILGYGDEQMDDLFRQAATVSV